MENCKRCEELYEIKNYLDSLGLCGACDKELKSKVHPILRMLTYQAKEDYTELERSNIYGTVAENIYRKCCEKFGWDLLQIGKFAKQKRLYAEITIHDEVWGVWFLAHSNMTGTTQKDEKWANVIDEKNPSLLYMYIDASQPIETLRKNKRIVFAKDQYGRYIFLGCYMKIDSNEDERKETYKLISDVFPIKR